MHLHTNESLAIRFLISRTTSQHISVGYQLPSIGYCHSTSTKQTNIVTYSSCLDFKIFKNFICLCLLSIYCLFICLFYCLWCIKETTKDLNSLTFLELPCNESIALSTLPSAVLVMRLNLQIPLKYEWEKFVFTASYLLRLSQDKYRIII